MAFVRLMVFGFLALSVVYLSLSLYSRSVRREALEDEWDAERPEGISREDYVSRGIVAYRASVRPKLLLLVYIVPMVLMIGVIYVTNSN